MKKGFTLVELIAVLALIAIVVLLGVPSVIGVLDRSKTKTFVMEAESLIDAALMAYDEAVSFGITPNTCYTLADLSEYTDKEFDPDAVGSVSINKQNKEYLIWYYDGTRYVTGGEFGLIGESGSNEVVKGTPVSTNGYNECGEGFEYILTINVNGGDYDGETIISLSSGESYTLLAITKPNYTLKNWTLSNGTIINGNIFTMGRANTTITANWDVAQHTLIVLADGGIWSGTTPQTNNAGSTVTIDPPTRTYHEFTGWRRSDNNELITETSFTMPDNDLTITAEWNRTITILEIITDDGMWEGTTPQEQNIGGTVIINPPTKANHYFLGWRRSDNNELITEPSFTMPENDLTLTAEWVIEVTDIPYTAPTALVLNPYTLFEVQVDGWYQIELWGASGGKSIKNGAVNNNFAKGAYTSGIIYLNRDNKLYITVGGSGTNAVVSKNSAGGYNGGGLGTWDNADDESAGGGGGATDVRYNNNTLNDRIMVAGAGGGSSWDRAGGVGGSLTGGNGNGSNGGTQTSGYSMGQGQNGSGGGGDSDGVGGGGAGYWGGYTSNTAAPGTGSGGSSYISGYTGCVAVTTAGRPKPDCITNNSVNSCSIHYSGKIFTDGIMTAGVSTGHGKAKITYIGAS